MLYSSKLGRFDQWFDCFTILFGVSSSDLMEEYENLKQMVRIEIGEAEEFEMWGGSFLKNYTWVEELISHTSRKGIIINK